MRLVHLADFEDFLFNEIQQRRDLAVRFIAFQHGIGAGGDDASKHGVLLDDLRVVFDIDRGRNPIHQQPQVIQAADLFKLMVLLEIVRQHHGVDAGLADGVEGDHRIEDHLVGRAVEGTLKIQPCQTDGSRIGVGEHGTQHGDFGIFVVGFGTVEREDSGSA